MLGYLGESTFLRIASKQGRKLAIIKKRHFNSWSTWGALPDPPQFASRRVVVTGLGTVSPLGIGTERMWERLIKGECGIEKITRFDTSKCPVTIAGLVPEGSLPYEYDAQRLLAPSDLGPTSRCVRYATIAAIEALEDAKWKPMTDEQRRKTGVCVGSGIASVEDWEDQHNTFLESGARKVSPFFIPKILVNTAAGHLSMKFGFHGPNHAVSTACATGSHSIGDAFRFISSGYADVMIAGATEASVTPLTIAGFAKAKALSTKFQDNPHSASRPFDVRRDGFVMGEGAGVLVLEDLDHALQRDAKIYAEVRSYGLSGDAYHLTAPSPLGIGAKLSMKMALEHSGLYPEHIGYINCHATSTALGDNIEAQAIGEVFQDHASELFVSSSKGSIGHLLGAAGAVEAIITIKALETGILPPSLNFESHESTLPFKIVKEATEQPIRAALSNSFGFGGTNATLCFAKHEIESVFAGHFTRDLLGDAAISALNGLSKTADSVL